MRTRLTTEPETLPDDDIFSSWSSATSISTRRAVITGSAPPSRTPSSTADGQGEPKALSTVTGSPSPWLSARPRLRSAD